MKQNSTKCFVISPLNHLDLMEQGDGIFVLAHLYLQNENYRSFIKEKKREGWFTILDNGAAEKNLVSISDLIAVCKDLMPDEVIAPDILFDADKTLENLYFFINRMKQENLINKINLFAVPQGSSHCEWLYCYNKMKEQTKVHTLGLSKISIPKCFGDNLQFSEDQGIKESRQICIKFLEEHDLFTKPVHCLGMGDPTEYEAYDNPFIRSTDSCYSVLSAINGIEFGKSKFKRIVTPKDYFTNTMTEEQIKLAKTNINYLKKILGGKI